MEDFDAERTAELGEIIDELSWAEAYDRVSVWLRAEGFASAARSLAGGVRALRESVSYRRAVFGVADDGVRFDGVSDREALARAHGYLMHVGDMSGAVRWLGLLLGQ